MTIIGKSPFALVEGVVEALPVDPVLLAPIMTETDMGWDLSELIVNFPQKIVMIMTAVFLEPVYR